MANVVCGLLAQACAVGLAFLSLIPTVHGIGCFVCSSIDGSEPDCDDTFNNTGKFYKPHCMAPRPMRNGVFPATSCIKLKGILSETKQQYCVRDCVVDSGGVNSETELARSDHCGLIKSINFNDKHMSGCVLSCNTDGCNVGTNTLPSNTSYICAIILCLLHAHRQFMAFGFT